MLPDKGSLQTKKDFSTVWRLQ